MCYTIDMKKCNKCHVLKELIYFHKNSSNKKDGHENRCKDCAAESQRIYRSKPHGRAKMLEHARNGYHRNKKENPESFEPKLAYRRKYGQIHKKELNEYSKQYIKERKEIDIEFKL